MHLPRGTDRNSRQRLPAVTFTASLAPQALVDTASSHFNPSVIAGDNGRNSLVTRPVGPILLHLDFGDKFNRPIRQCDIVSIFAATGLLKSAFDQQSTDVVWPA